MSIRSRRVCHEDPRIYSGPPLDPLAARYSSREPGLAETKPSTWCVRTSPARGGMTSSQGPSPVAIGVASAAPLRSPHLGAVTAPAPGERAGSKDVSLCAAATRSPTLGRTRPGPSPERQRPASVKSGSLAPERPTAWGAWETQNTPAWFLQARSLHHTLCSLFIWKRSNAAVADPVPLQQQQHVPSPVAQAEPPPGSFREARQSVKICEAICPGCQGWLLCLDKVAQDRISGRPS